MKRLLLSFLVLAFAGTLFAKDVQINDANTLAKNAYFQKLNSYVSDVEMTNIVISEQFTITEDGLATIYAFNFENYGYILISADDAIEPVLGYSFTSQYNPAKEADNFISYLTSYGEHINYLRENQIEASAEVALQWNNLETFKPENFTSQSKEKDVEALIQSTWDQDNPYNFLCPPRSTQPNSNGKGLVGCVATAMTQVMYYWRYPNQGVGSNTYWEPEILDYISADFGAATYEWDGMVDNVTALMYEVAEICFHAGVAVDMDYYSSGGSGAYSTDVPFALKSNFSYANNVVHAERSSYTLTNWQNMIEAELDDNIPVYYSGYSNDGGHAFVCDGYHDADNTYHFNFGWGGYGDGYFLITNAGGYTQGQQIVHNITPGDANYPYGCQPGTEVTPLKGSIVDGSGPQEDYAADAIGTWLINPQTDQDSVTDITVHFTHMDTDVNDVITIHDGALSTDPVLGTFSGSAVPTDYISSTGNKMLIVFEANGDGTTGAGWKIEYDTDQPTWCTSSPAVYETPTGTITDGSGDFYYNGNSQCMFKIEPMYAIGCTLSFTEFDIENENDVLKVYDAGNNSLLAELTGNEIPDPFFVESGKFFLLFTTNGAVNRPGWSADWEAGNVGIQSNSFEGVSIFPNPTNNQLNISFTTEEKETFSIELMSATGQVVYKESVTAFTGKYNNQIDVSEMAKGVYFLNIKGTTGNINEKVMVK